MVSSGVPYLLLFLLAGLSLSAQAQIDPEKRQMVQAGFSQSLDGRGPPAGYVYYYLNEPNVRHSSQTLRFVLAPVYIDSEVGLKKAFGENTDLGLGLAGGGLADSYTEYRDGRYLRGESFGGNGFRATASLYHTFGKVGPAPVFGIFRVQDHYASYYGQKNTGESFSVPYPENELLYRAALRLGGVPPVLRPGRAAELSIWQESRYRFHAQDYGYGGDRRIERSSQLFWARALLVYDLPSADRRFAVSLTGGTAYSPDRFSAFRLGGTLPRASEFPLSLPGYFYQELGAANFALLSGSYMVPLSKNHKTWTAEFRAATARLDYAPGEEEPGKFKSGIGFGLVWVSRSKAWQVVTDYGYGINAHRPGGIGGHTVGLLLQFDFRRANVPFFHPVGPGLGLERVLLGD